MTIEERKEQARELHRQGYNCAQCVAMVYSDLTGVAPDTTARLTAAYGGGVGGEGDLCGVVSGMAFVVSALRYEGPATKLATYQSMKPYYQAFAERNGGCTACRDLRRPGKKSCMTLIEEGVEIISQEAKGKSNK
ncbi:MAG: C-GCAxxG-C-C family protein [Bacteroidales bacterium]|nr:C-GCAxxG-C-C family protein [Bacteroidales bacterium]